jgi:hypothetical protein
MNGSWCLVNLSQVFFVDFDEEDCEVRFDNTLRVKINKQDYEWIRRDVLRKMFRMHVGNPEKEGYLSVAAFGTGYRHSKKISLPRL